MYGIDYQKSETIISDETRPQDVSDLSRIDVMPKNILRR